MVNGGQLSGPVEKVYAMEEIAAALAQRCVGERGGEIMVRWYFSACL